MEEAKEAEVGGPCLSTTGEAGSMFKLGGLRGACCWEARREGGFGLAEVAASAEEAAVPSLLPEGPSLGAPSILALDKPPYGIVSETEDETVRPPRPGPPPRAPARPPRPLSPPPLPPRPLPNPRKADPLSPPPPQPFALGLTVADPVCGGREEREAMLPLRFYGDEVGMGMGMGGEMLGTIVAGSGI